MDQTSEELTTDIDKQRKQIDVTSTSLKEKVEQLEEQVLGTVKGTTEAVGDTVESVKETVAGTVESVKETVAETIESVKETVQDTVASVKRALNVKYQTEQHPWPMVGGSVVAGFLAGKLFSSWRGRSADYSGHNGHSASAAPAARSLSSLAAESSRPAPTPSSGPGIFSRLQDTLGGEIDKVKEMAIGTIFGLLRDMAKRALPHSLSDKVEEVMDNITTKLGGKPIEGPVEDSSPQGTGTTH